MKLKNFFSFAIVFLAFLIPVSSSAQITATYGHSNVAETSVVISGQIGGTGFQNMGYAIIFGSLPGLLLNVVPIVPDFNGNYFVQINNLLGDSTYYYQMVYGLTATAMGPVKSFKTANSSLILNHKSVTQNGAKIYGSASPGHPSFIIKYGKTQALADGSFSVSVNANGGFEQFFPVSLPPNTRIYYRAVNPLLPLIVYSPINSFKTLDEVVNFDFRNLTSSSVSVFGSVTDGTPAPKVFLSSDDPVTPATVEIEQSTVLAPDNTWEANFTGLEPETKYYTRVADGTDPSYTYLIKTFTTTSSNINLQFFNVTDSSMKVSGRLPLGTESLLLCFATNMEALNTSPDCGNGPLFESAPGTETFEKTITNLAANTTYYFVARNTDYTTDLSQAYDVKTLGPSGPGTIGNDINLEEGPASLVPCVGLRQLAEGETGKAYDCDFNALMKLINNIIDFLLKTIALPLFALIFAYVGWLYMSSAGDPGKRSKAKGILWNSILGFIIAMAAFVIIKTILFQLGYTGISFGII